MLFGAAKPASAQPSVSKGLLTGTLNYIMDAESWPTLDPAASAFHGTDQAILSLTDGNLITLNPNGTYRPGLLSSYSLSSNAMTFTMELRPGLKFQDGTPLNSAALKANLERDLSPKLDCTCLSFIDAIKSISTPSSTEVVLHFSHPDGTILPALAASTATFVVSPTAVAKEGSKFGISPVGAGPYRISKNIVNSTLKLQRWPGYWDAKAVHVQNIEITTGSSPSEYATLQSGGAQVLGLPFGEPMELKEAKENSSLSVHVAEGYGGMIYMNPGEKPFNNILAREAIQYATNAQALNGALCYGFCPAGEQIVGSAQVAYPGNKLRGFRSYNLAKAKALVKELHGLSFTYSGGNTATTIEMSAALAKQWEAAGMKVKIAELSETATIASLTKGDFQAEGGAYAPQEDSALSVAEVMDCPAFFDPHYCDKKINVDVAKAEESPNPKTQAKFVAEAEELGIVKDAAFAPTNFTEVALVTDKSVKGAVFAEGQVYLAGITAI